MSTDRTMSLFGFVGGRCSTFLALRCNVRRAGVVVEARWCDLIGALNSSLVFCPLLPSDDDTTGQQPSAGRGRHCLRIHPLTPWSMRGSTRTKIFTSSQSSIIWGDCWTLSLQRQQSRVTRLCCTGFVDWSRDSDRRRKNRFVRRRRDRASAQPGFRSARSEPPHSADTSFARQDRFDRCRGGGEVRTFWNRHGCPEATRRDNRIDPATSHQFVGVA